MTSPAALPRFAPDWALFLDVDGTLAAIVSEPDAVRIDAQTIDTLQRIDDRLDGAVALVSGRPIAVLDRLFAPLVLPAAGLHGLERRTGDGTVVRHATPGGEIEAVKSALAGFAGRAEGLRVEDKGATVALHYRNAPDQAEAAAAFAADLAAQSAGRLTLQRGHMVAEIRPVGPDKGNAIEAFMAEPPFKGRVPVFVGDDVTDENGFRVVNRLGGHSIRIGPAGTTDATVRIAGFDAFHQWLSGLVPVSPALSTESGLR